MANPHLDTLAPTTRIDGEDVKQDRPTLKLDSWRTAKQS